ncbi:MAG: hypothetical protein BroJett040_10770 [Oligoflexia bacterium]|nr:MAG: hypothetical protein BroJett040_10770 [Oligoflexia bacterium]
MKTQKLILQASLATLMALFGQACAKKSDPAPVIAVPAPVTGVGVDTSTNVGPFQSSTGASVQFTPDNISVLNEYVALHPVNNPQNMALNVDLHDVGGGRYGGVIQISYYDNGQWNTGRFETGTGTLTSPPEGSNLKFPSDYVGTNYAEFNKWFIYNGKKVFHGFFQDSYGAIVLVIDNALDLGDGGGITEVSGSVYFKNFTTGYAQQGSVPWQGQVPCWFISYPGSPYNCQTFLGGNGLVQTTSALYPGNGYKRLGTFSSLNKVRAFNE